MKYINTHTRQRNDRQLDSRPCGALTQKKRYTSTAMLLLSAGALLIGPIALATKLVGAQGTVSGDEGFSLQVSPSPLIATVKPGIATTLDLRIRNTSSVTQALKMGMRSFTIDETSGKVNLQKTSPADVARFVRFEQPTFSVAAGAIFTQKVIIETPASAGFTYSFATTISQQDPPKAEKGKTALQGTIAVFTLLNVDKPGATRQLTLTRLTAAQHVYEYLPADFSLTLKNSGNTLAQPKGTVYIQRHSDDPQPLAAIPLNQNGGFILPNTSRSIQASWNGGFPHYETTVDSQTQASQSKLSWQGGDVSKLRVGRYVAKVVATYDDGQRDVPLTAEVTFWVIPWRMLAVATLIIALVGIGIVTTFRKSTKALRPAKRGQKPSAKAGTHNAPRND